MIAQKSVAVDARLSVADRKLVVYALEMLANDMKRLYVDEGNTKDGRAYKKMYADAVRLCGVFGGTQEEDD